MSIKENRRRFLQRCGCGVTMASLASNARILGGMSALADRTPARDDPGYRALVCVLLSGGNDGNNTLVPNHSDASVSNYSTYSALRNSAGLAIAQKQLLPIAVPRLGGLTYGLHPSLGPASVMGGINNGIYELYSKGKLAIVSNVGNLIRPIVKQQYLEQPSWRPYQLFSHSDQVQQQQSTRSDAPSQHGWGGLIADRKHGEMNPKGRVPMITSIGGTQLFTLGRSTMPLAIKDAATPLDQTLALSANCCTDQFAEARKRALTELRSIDLGSDLVRAASHIMDQAESATAALVGSQEVSAPFPATVLGDQLKQVARLVKKRDELNIRRQIFFVELAGFDTHQDQLNGPESQTLLLAQLSQAMRAFYDEMGAQGVQDRVTMFTLSDFGRTMSPAGVGSRVGTDHAWGNHMFVLGGAVAGGNLYGSVRPDGSGTILPELVLGGPDDIDGDEMPRGRWLPTTSVEQYAATLGRWFGLGEEELPLIFPHLANFPGSNLGFISS